jgi:hypothetical protein
MQDIKPMTGPVPEGVTVTSSRTVAVRLPRGQVFTLGHLRQLVADAGPDAPDNSPVTRADLFIRGKLRGLTVEING